MKKLSLMIAALHASALALGAQPGAARAQDAAEVRAYMNALALGTPEAMAAFLDSFPQSDLPGSQLGASIAASIGKPPATAPRIMPAAGPAAPTAEASVSRAAPAEDDGIY